ncbi:MAG TPA: hypothetical protein PK582_02555, partial [Prolixibacteraceae bacterium]|nr:hypothetical protein [Prolixibacteraceae bacterium]
FKEQPEVGSQFKSQPKVGSWFKRQLESSIQVKGPEKAGTWSDKAAERMYLCCEITPMGIQ